jgi:hypothetical protein
VRRRHAYVKLYDRRGGAAEIEFKQDEQGFGLDLTQ